MKNEKRYHASGLTVEETRADDGATQRIVGYAAVFYRADDPGTEFGLWDGAVERIMPTAFDAAIERGDDVVAVLNHNFDNLLGRTRAGTLKLETDSTGLRYTIEHNDSSLFGDVRDAIQRNDLDGSSFQFQIDDDGVEWRSEDGVEVREIRSVSRLIDVGPVVFPAYDGSSAGARSEFEAISDIRDQAEKDRKSRQAILRRLEIASMM